MKHNQFSRAKVRSWADGYAAAQPEPEAALPEPAAKADPLHGYTLEHINTVARHALLADRWHKAGDTADRYDAIWHALAEHLLTTPTPPTRSELVGVGVRAADAHVHREMHHHGRSNENFGETVPQFERYWTTAPAPSPEGAVVERTALYQVLPLLTARQAEALNALALCGDYAAAAASIGSTYKTFNSLIKQARQRIYRAWHQGETPPKSPWRKDTRAVKGAQGGKTRLTESEVEALRARYVGGERLRAVAADAGVPVSTLSALLRGNRRPLPDPVGAS